MNNRYKNSKFAKNTATLMVGTLFAQVIPIASMPILTRLYTPAEFGTLALFVALFSILSTISTGRYELAVMAPKGDDEARDIVALGIAIALIMSILSGVLIILTQNDFARLLGDDRIKPWLLFLPPLILLSGIYQCITCWLNRQKSFKEMSQNKMVQAGSISLVQLSIGVFSQTGLIIGHFLGWLFSVSYILKNTQFKFKGIRFLDIVNSAKKHKEYPLIQAPASMLNTLSLNAPVFFIAKYFDVGAAGIYSVVLKILSAPAGLIAKSVGQVFFQQSSDLAKNSPKKLVADFYSVTLKLCLIAGIVFSIPFFFGQEIFALVLGNSWTRAGALAEIVTLAVAIKFVVSPLSFIFLAIGQIKLGAIWQTTYFFSTIMMLVIASSFEFSLFVIILVAHDILFYCFYYALMVYSLKVYLKKKG